MKELQQHITAGTYIISVTVFHGMCYLRNRSDKGLLLCKMDRWAWEHCFVTDKQKQELFDVILKWFFNA